MFSCERRSPAPEHGCVVVAADEPTIARRTGCAKPPPGSSCPCSPRLRPGPARFRRRAPPSRLRRYRARARPGGSRRRLWRGRHARRTRPPRGRAASAARSPAGPTTSRASRRSSRDASNLSEEGIRSAADDVRSCDADTRRRAPRPRQASDRVGRRGGDRPRLALRHARDGVDRDPGDGRGRLRASPTSRARSRRSRRRSRRWRRRSPTRSHGSGRRRRRASSRRHSRTPRVRRHLVGLDGSAHVRALLDGGEVAMHVLDDDRALADR